MITAWSGHGYPPDGPWRIFDTTVWVDGVEATCMLAVMMISHPPKGYRTEAEARDGHAAWLEWARSRYATHDPTTSPDSDSVECGFCHGEPIWVHPVTERPHFALEPDVELPTVT